MKRNLLGILLVSLFLAGCASTGAPTEMTAPINTVAPGVASILVPPTLSPEDLTPQPDAPVSVTLNNQASWNVCYVYITPPDQDSWGSDRLEKDEELAPGSNRVFSLPAGVYDVLAENCDYLPLDERYGVDIAADWTWEVGELNLLYEADFSSTAGFTLQGAASASAVDEEYISRATQKSTWAAAAAGQSYAGSVTTVEATPLSPEMGDIVGVAYGLACRVQPGGNGYAFLIRSDLYASIQKITAGRLSPLVDWQAITNMDPGSALNVISATCDGQNLKLRVNGLTVIKTTDTAYLEGDAALVIVPYAYAPAEVKFHNFLVTTP